MHLSRLPREVLLLLLPCIFLLGWGAYLRVRPTQWSGTQELSVTDIEFSPARGADVRVGFDTQVRLVLAFHGAPPQRVNHRYVGSNVICRNTRFVQMRGGKEHPITGQTPRVVFTSGNPSYVTFVFSKAQLPSDECFLCSTIVRTYSYNTPGGGKFYESPGVPVEIPLCNL